MITKSILLQKDGSTFSPCMVPSHLWIVSVCPEMLTSFPCGNSLLKNQVMTDQCFWYFGRSDPFERAVLTCPRFLDNVPFLLLLLLLLHLLGGIHLSTSNSIHLICPGIVSWTVRVWNVDAVETQSNSPKVTEGLPGNLHHPLTQPHWLPWLRPIPPKFNCHTPHYQIKILVCYVYVNLSHGHLWPIYSFW